MKVTTDPEFPDSKRYQFTPDEVKEALARMYDAPAWDNTTCGFIGADMKHVEDEFGDSKDVFDGISIYT